jgi:hypothetical protein
MGQTGRRVKFDEGDGIVVVGGGGLPLPRIASGEESVTVAKARLDDPVVDARPSFVARDDRAQQDASVSNQDKAAGWFSFLFMFFFNELFFFLKLFVGIFFQRRSIDVRFMKIVLLNSYMCLFLLGNVFSCSHELFLTNYPSITYYWRVPLLLDHSYLVGKLTSSKIADTKVSGF